MNGHIFLNISNNWLLHIATHLFTKMSSFCRFCSTNWPGSGSDTYAERRCDSEFKCSVLVKKTDEPRVSVPAENIPSSTFTWPSLNSSTNSNKIPYVKNSNSSLRILGPFWMDNVMSSYYTAFLNFTSVPECILYIYVHFILCP